MFDPRRALIYLYKIARACLIIGGLLFPLSFMAVYLSYPLGIRPWPTSLIFDLGLPVLLGMIPGLAALGMIWLVAGRFVRSLYGLESNKAGRTFISTCLFGQLTGGPYLVVKEGKIAVGSEAVRKIGGPGGLVLYNDSAVVLERAGNLTRVFRGSPDPPFTGLLPPPRLEPFEKAWDVIDLRPQRWEYKVSAITQDGILINYNADVRYQIGDTDEAIFKAATGKWIREAYRTEPDRLLTWDKLAVIGDTEGTLRSILARYFLDQLIDPICREKIRRELEESLKDSTPGLGVRILSVALGDIELEGQVLQQWIDTWQAKREREMARIIAEGEAERAKAVEEARTEIRASMLVNAIKIFTEATKRAPAVSRDFVTLSFVELIKRVSKERNFLLPTYIWGILERLQEGSRRTGLPPTTPRPSGSDQGSG